MMVTVIKYLTADNIRVPRLHFEVTGELDTDWLKQCTPRRREQGQGPFSRLANAGYIEERKVFLE